MNEEKLYEKIEELLDYTWSIEEQMRRQILENFNKLANHKSEMNKIRDNLIDLQIMINKSKESQNG